MTQTRILERNGHKGEIIGPPKRCHLWIDGKLYSAAHFSTVRAARNAFVSYTTRQAAIAKALGKA